LHTGEKKDEGGHRAQILLELLIETCDKALQLCIEKGILSAHEAKSAARHVFIQDELATIKKNLQMLSSVAEADVEEILAFEERLRGQMAVRHCHIVPADFDAAPKVPIDSLYVKPTFIVRLHYTANEDVEEPLSVFLASAYRNIVVGNPGCGKSTLACKLCHELSSRYDEALYAGRQLTPFLVVLRDYGAGKKENKYSILEYLELTSKSKYQVTPPRGAFEYLLLNGHLLVVFDGLDELLDTSYRREVSDDIESFSGLYPSVPVLVTSREVGYEQAPLAPERFQLARIAPFNEAQTTEYVKKWFAANDDQTDGQPKRD
jgi:hypothetical protein